MILKKKSWLWIFTWPFGYGNYTTIGEAIYCPDEFQPSPDVFAHESIHSAQQAKTGIIKYILLYLLVMPFLWNPWRFKWEFEAYVLGSKLPPDEAVKILRSKSYAWLIFNGLNK